MSGLAERAMEALGQLVAPEPEAAPPRVTLQCVHADKVKHSIVWDPVKAGRGICPSCNAVYQVILEKAPGPIT